VTEENTGDGKTKTPGAQKIIILSIAFPLLVALACFIVLALVPAPKGPPLKDPLRSLLTGLGVIGVATPLCIAGFTLKKRFASSPYFEGSFIATVLNVFGFACFAAGLACLILGVYDLIVRFLDSRQ
jgi:hypothetical protein